jgi:hypothetical protein
MTDRYVGYSMNLKKQILLIYETGIFRENGKCHFLTESYVCFVLVFEKIQFSFVDGDVLVVIG